MPPRTTTRRWSPSWAGPTSGPTVWSRTSQGPVEGGFRIIDTWASREQAERFWAEHLDPAVARAHGDRGAEQRSGFGWYEVGR